ncbi:MarR family winged helix-turn-helix transcriptional regulator [Streptomyces sp. 4N124]|uniref:MarR family winged helix-turn-helix transcriptional regulator n=1 Tax=Streptomyces sp. 4N124 TaxID=3457420 RepID=UPI003FD6643A
MSPLSPTVAPSPEAVEIERALTRVAYLNASARRHAVLTALAGVPLDRAAVALLRRLADAEPLRLGQLAQLLAVEASHVTRQVRQLERSGHVERVPDPDDGRALRVRPTPLGMDAVARIHDIGTRGMQLALADWSREELRQLALLFGRMVDALLAYAADEGQAPRIPGD